VEAQACGKPVVAFDIGPHPEVVENGVTGILVPPNDVIMLSAAIIELLRNKDTRQATGTRGRRMVTKNFCDNASTELSDILTQKKVNPNLSQ
jgi:glycosyltransferase involved in cell wall biosynthesis